MFSYVYFFNKFHICFCWYLCFLLFSMSVFLCHFAPPFEVGYLPIFLSICLLQYRFTLQLHWQIWLCDKINLALFLINITIILIRLFQMIWFCATSFSIVSVCLFFCKRKGGGLKKLREYLNLRGDLNIVFIEWPKFFKGQPFCLKSVKPLGVHSLLLTNIGSNFVIVNKTTDKVKVNG